MAKVRLHRTVLKEKDKVVTLRTYRERQGATVHRGGGKKSSKGKGRNVQRSFPSGMRVWQVTEGRIGKTSQVSNFFQENAGWEAYRKAVREA